ncbi:MAG: response regulator transcription factor [Spirochaetes bacterium]|nr:response regulator transcription factor [Spirochaetota bacterium]
MVAIIIVEDNESIRESVKSYLELENHVVYDFDRIAGVYEALEHKNIDIIVLDIMLPDGNGFLLAKRIRKKYDTPIIFLSARTSESDRITGFEIGGDDYIIKPFSPKELVLRIKSILKRLNQKQVKNNSLEFKYQGSILKLKKDVHKLELDNKEIYLTSAEWEILNFLAINAGIVLSRAKLQGESLDYMAEGSERTIDTHIKKIRAKLDNPGWIETVRGYGYRFNGEQI